MRSIAHARALILMVAITLAASQSGCGDGGSTESPRAAASGGSAGDGGSSVGGTSGTSGAAGAGGMSGAGGSSNPGGSAGMGGVAGTAGNSGGGGVAGASGTGGSSPCTEVLVGGPQASSYPFTMGDQQAWSHDDGFAAGYFHTYDALDVGGAGDVPHKVHVLVPRQYGPCDDGYPVIYMNDGSTSFWKGGPGNKSWDVAQGLQSLYDLGAIPTVIVVAIEPVNRDSEYSHVQMAPTGDCCGVDAYTAYVSDRIKPFIDAHYRTAPGRETTAIVGSSRGGLASFYMSTRRPDVFGKTISMSPSFWAGLDPVFGGTFPGGPLSSSPLMTGAASTLSNTAMRPRFWIDWGLIRTGGTQNSEIEAAATERGIEMVELLQTTYGYVDGADMGYEEDPIGEHDEISWGRRFPSAMKSLFHP